MRLQISFANGLEVIIPNRVSFEEAEKFVFKKKDWIDKHFKRLDRKEGYFFQGKKLDIIQVPDLTKDIFDGLLVSDSKIYVRASCLEEDQLKELYEDWLFKRAKKYLLKRLEEIACANGFTFNRSSVRRQKSRWGSCSSRKTISLNFRLMMFEKQVIDYVIIHELCHLKEMNHSSRFWKHVEQIMPEYRNYKRILKY
jgi:hypothetical protein